MVLATDTLRLQPEIDHQRALVKKHREVAAWDLTDNLTDIKKRINRMKDEFDLVVLDYLGPIGVVEGIDFNVPIVYISHNCEAALAESLHGKNDPLTNSIKQMEARLLERSDLFVYCGEGDLTEIDKRYKTHSPGYQIPNGTDLRDGIRAGANRSSKEILFVGSGHPPNVVAAMNLIPVAKAMPDYTFNLVGDASRYLDDVDTPENIKILGRVSDGNLDKLFRNSFAFINPMESGSGTHLKLMRALSYGMPIISSTVGARGFSDKEIKDTILVADNTDAMVEAIHKLENGLYYKQVSENTLSVVQTYDWKKIQNDFKNLALSLIK
jgi:glycosyltransferase involved in cell wall biosynthesis